MITPILTRPRLASEADLTSAHTLLGCLIREVSAPDGQMWVDGGHLLLRLPHIGSLLRARLLRVSTVAAHRFAGAIQHQDAASGSWEDIDLQELAALVTAELTARTGEDNEEFAAQVLASRDSLADILDARPDVPARTITEPFAAFIDSEQSLIAGHPRHPAPKWRSGDAGKWRQYSPETRTAFPLHWLAVPENLVFEQSVGGGFDEHASTNRLLAKAAPDVPAGHKALPVHPWQHRLLSTDKGLGPVLSAAVADGTILDLGQTGLPFHPTASVRTLYQPETDVFLKTSLNVRITNCLRKNSVYELSGAVELTRLLREPLAEVAIMHPNFTLLEEPAARSAQLPESYGTPEQRLALLEGLGTIVRTGIAGWALPGQTVHLAASLTAAPDPAGTRTRLSDLADPADPRAWARQWWKRYVQLMVPPLLRLWAEHGVVLEPHLQNVLAVLGPDGMPLQILARDLEGTKLVGSRHTDVLAALPPEISGAVAYDEEQGWNRIAYCLFVNHLAEMAGALADLAPEPPGFENELWDILGGTVAETSTALGNPPRLRALLAGVPLPAKTNMLIRWQRRADKLAGYVAFPNPFGGALTEEQRRPSQKN
ncbi:IucA/IucC family protein [Arthrobacter sp. Br18]|uniref:IucA/IucC family protein n=1 Tax=Arthrobacter sp. Br18 TaxID=1312954 RepID=UPI001C1E0620|nr:IucA/IucC family protein [Arthrobacter sp. Br18]